MAKYIQGKDGKFAGSIGDGKHNVPSASTLPPVLTPMSSRVTYPGQHQHELLMGAFDFADKEHASGKPLDIDRAYDAYSMARSVERVRHGVEFTEQISAAVVQEGRAWHTATRWLSEAVGTDDEADAVEAVKQELRNVGMTDAEAEKYGDKLAGIARSVKENPDLAKEHDRPSQEASTSDSAEHGTKPASSGFPAANTWTPEDPIWASRRTRDEHLDRQYLGSDVVLKGRVHSHLEHIFKAEYRKAWREGLAATGGMNDDEEGRQFRNRCIATAKRLTETEPGPVASLQAGDTILYRGTRKTIESVTSLDPVPVAPVTATSTIESGSAYLFGEAALREPRHEMAERFMITFTDGTKHGHDVHTLLTTYSSGFIKFTHNE